MIDDIATESRTAKRATCGWTQRWMAFPTHHAAVRQTFSLTTWRWNEAERYTRTTAKPIGWALDEAKRKEAEAMVTKGADDWGPSWDITDINNFVKQLLVFGKLKGIRRSRISATEEKIRAALDTTHDDATRAKLRQTMWHERRHIRREKSEAHFATGLKNLKNGGWGKKDLKGRKEPMTRLKMHDGAMTSDKTTIAEQATQYYASLFDITPSTHDRDRMTNLHKYVDKQYDLFMRPDMYEAMATNDAGDDAAVWQYMGLSIDADMVDKAIRSCKEGKTCAKDGVVSEVWQELIATEPRWNAGIAWRFNRRL